MADSIENFTENEEILQILKDNYSIPFDRIEFFRDGGSTTYIAFAAERKYFLRRLKPAFFDTAIKGADIHMFLQERDFPVPLIIVTRKKSLYIQDKNGLFILYEYIEGAASDPDTDAEALGPLVGRLHSLMKEYPGELVKRDKYFFIGKYIDILNRKKYPKADEFQAYGEALWEKVRDLPQRYCHGDMYSGNIHKDPKGRLYVLDFDTSCEGFPMYDIALLCNRTHYFDFNEEGYEKSRQVFSRFLPEYRKHNPLSQKEADSFFDLIALYHFALQAVIIEIHGLDCVDDIFLNKQLDWLNKWRKQCAAN